MMKNFLVIFLMTFITCAVFMFFGGTLIFENIWATVALAAFIFSILITLFSHQETRINELEKQIKALEAPNEQEA